MFYKYLWVYLFLVLTLAVLTCKESGQNPQDVVLELPTENLNYEQHMEKLFTLKCSNPDRVGGCHISSPFARELDLGNYGVIVSHQVESGEPLVRYDEASGKGDGQGSYLYRVLISNDVPGSTRMPKNLAPLSANNVNAVKVWINEGIKEKP
jgi:hypothetical protein